MYRMNPGDIITTLCKNCGVRLVWNESIPYCQGCEYGVGPIDFPDMYPALWAFMPMEEAENMTEVQRKLALVNHYKKET